MLRALIVAGVLSFGLTAWAEPVDSSEGSSQGESQKSSESAEGGEREPANHHTLMKVLKTRDGYAVIRLPKGMLLPQGSVYQVVDYQKEGYFDPYEQDLKRRLVGADVSMSFVKQTEIRDVAADPAPSIADQIGLASLRYGWNFQVIEFGLLFDLAYREKEAASDSDQGVSENQVLVGGFFDWNFVPNVTESQAVVGARLSLLAGWADSSSVDAGGLAFKARPAFVAKWFGLGTQHAFVAEIGYEFQVNQFVKNDSNFDNQTAGFVGKLGVQTYF